MGQKDKEKGKGKALPVFGSKAKRKDDTSTPPPTKKSKKDTPSTTGKGNTEETTSEPIRASPLQFREKRSKQSHDSGRDPSTPSHQAEIIPSTDNPYEGEDGLLDPIQQHQLRQAGLTTGGTPLDLTLMDPNEVPMPDDDPFAGMDAFVKANMPQSAQAEARASGGKYYKNIVRTLYSHSGSTISSPRDPKAVVFPIRISDDAQSGRDFLDEEGDIPSTSKRFDSNYKKGLVREVLKCGDAEYKQTLRGISEGHLGPIFNNLIESIFRLEYVQKYMAQAKEDSKRASQMQNLCETYLSEQTERIKAHNSHAVRALTEAVGKAKEENKILCASNLELLDQIAELKRRDQDIAAAKFEKEEAEQRASIALNQVDELERKLKEANDRAEAAEKTKDEVLSQTNEQAIQKFLEGEASMKARIAEAWEMGPSASAPFEYFERRLDYVTKVHLAKELGEEAPSPFHSDNEDEDDDDKEDEKEDEVSDEQGKDDE